MFIRLSYRLDFIQDTQSKRPNRVHARAAHFTVPKVGNNICSTQAQWSICLYQQYFKIIKYRL